MKTMRLTGYVVLGLLASNLPVGDAAAETDERSFRFHYGAVIRGVEPDAQVRIWLPVAPSNEFQTVTLGEHRLPAAPSISTEPVYGNRIMYLETTGNEARELPLELTFDIERREVRGLEQSSAQSQPVALDPAQRKLYLSANRKIPVGGRPLELLKNSPLPRDPLALAEVLYRRVDDHMRYDKSQPGYGEGDVLWACDSRFGNCTDFHSLFISLARANDLPARFEMGFPLPPERGEGEIGGYHCWAFFFVDGRGWTPVDISEADKHPQLKNYYFGNLTADRVTFTIGRDLELVPRQAGPPLNYFIYPHVEVDGRAWPREQVELRFAYQDDAS